MGEGGRIFFYDAVYCAVGAASIDCLYVLLPMGRITLVGAVSYTVADKMASNRISVFFLKSKENSECIFGASSCGNVLHCFRIARLFVHGLIARSVFAFVVCMRGFFVKRKGGGS